MHFLDNSGVFKLLQLNLFLLQRAGTWHIISEKILPNTNCQLSTKITAILCRNCGQVQLLLLTICAMWKGSGDSKFFFDVVFELLGGTQVTNIQVAQKYARPGKHGMSMCSECKIIAHVYGLITYEPC